MIYVVQIKSFQIFKACLFWVYKGSEVLKYPEIFLRLQCKMIRISAIEICLLKTFGRL